MIDTLYLIKQIVDAFLEWKYSFFIMSFPFLDMVVIYICYMGLKIFYKYFVKILGHLKNVGYVVLLLAYCSVSNIFENIKCLVDTKLKVWYALWVALGVLYLHENWTEAMVFSLFSGNTLIFCAWLMLIYIPFIKEIDTPWLKTKFNKMEENLEKNKIYYNQELEFINNNERLKLEQEKENLKRILSQQVQQNEVADADKE